MSSSFFKNEKFIPADRFIVGVDVGKKRSCARGITVRGKVVTNKPFWFENNREGFESLLVRISEWMQELNLKDLIIGMEPSGPYWIGLANYLEENGIEVVIVNSYHVKKSKEMYDNSPRKTDPKDALIIAHLVDEGKFLRRAVLTEEIESLRIPLRDRERFVECKTKAINAIRSNLRVYFPELEELFSEITGASIMKLLSKFPLPCDVLKAGEKKLTSLLRKASRGQLGIARAHEITRDARKTVGKKTAPEQARKSFKRQVEFLKCLLSRIKELDKEITSLVKNAPCYEVLSTIPDVGDITISSLLCAVGDLRNYKSSGKVLKMIGMDVCEFSSGKWVGKRKISKRGDSIARKYTYQGALRMCKSKGLYREKYLGLRSRGKPAPVAFVAIACDLVRMMYSIARDGRPFEWNYIPPHLRKGKAVRSVDIPIWEKAA